MALPQVGGMLPNGNFKPVQFSTLMQATYHSTHVVPLISNRDYEGDIQKKGDIVMIRKKPPIEVFDFVIGQELEKQTELADEAIPLTIDYGHYFNIPLDDVQTFINDIDTQMIVAEQGGIAIGNRIERKVLRTIHTAAKSVVPAPNFGKENAIAYFAAARTKLRQLDIPEENLWAVVDPVTAQHLGISELSRADIMGGTVDILKTGKAPDRVQGFTVYISNNLQADNKTSKVLFGHMDALAFASKFQKSEVVRDPKAFADLVRSLVVYGYKVVQEKALGCMDITFKDPFQ